jgi:ABC-type phosphate transport system permease subunit
MKKVSFGFIFGLVAGIPLTVVFGPIGAIIVIAVASFVISASSNSDQKRIKSRPKSSRLDKETEELITAVLPVINHNK